jgi:peptidyl-prolyl cis-trans isomerase SurA
MKLPGRSSVIRLFIATMILPLVLNHGARTALAQDTARAAAVVNDQVISLWDLDMRVRLSLLLSGLPRTPEVYGRLRRQVLRSLINEELRVQEAKRLGVNVEEQQLRAAMAQISKRNRMSQDEFFALLQKENIVRSTVEDQIRADLMWQGVIRRRFLSTVQISDEEIDRMVANIKASEGRPELRLSEIFLVVDNASQRGEVLRTAERLVQQLREGASFPGLARQFSQAVTASAGGDLGWIREGQLPEELAEAAQGLRPGEMAGPIETFGGYYILFLRNQRQITAGEVRVSLKQILFAVPSGASRADLEQAAQRAARVRERIQDCATVDALAKEIGSPGSGDLGTVKLDDLPDGLRQLVGNLPIGQPSQPVQVSGGISLITVCQREGGEVARQQIRDRLLNQRLSRLSRRYLRDLRRAANLDIRI